MRRQRTTKASDWKRVEARLNLLRMRSACLFERVPMRTETHGPTFDLPVDRLRLTLAHELGHLVLHSQFVDDDPEQQANDFAAEFLMPEHLIKPALHNLTTGRLLDLKWNGARRCRPSWNGRPPVGPGHGR